MTPDLEVIKARAEAATPGLDRQAIRWRLECIQQRANFAKGFLHFKDAQCLAEDIHALDQECTHLLAAIEQLQKREKELAEALDLLADVAASTFDDNTLEYEREAVLKARAVLAKRKDMM